MNKYWIHKPSGQKAEVYREGDPMQLSWRHAPNTYIEVTKESLEEFYIPITKAEYDSDITLKEIEENRNAKTFNGHWKCIKNYNYPKGIRGEIYEVVGADHTSVWLKNIKGHSNGFTIKKHVMEKYFEEIPLSDNNLFAKLIENDKILCKSDCCSLKFTNIEAGDILRVNNTVENIAVLWGLTEGVKNKKIAVTSKDINEHFLLYNDEIEKIENSNSITKSLEVGGSHYQQPIQVWDFVYTNHIPFDEASIIKYICRHKQKNGAEDIEKAISYCKHILKTQYGKEE